MRLTLDAWAMGLAELTAQRSTCLRRHVGAVLLNAKGHVLSTGYNGVAAGIPHCNEVDDQGFSVVVHPWACKGSQSASGTDLDNCQAIHAEQNALLQCKDVYSINKCFVTTSPCMTCLKLLLNTSCSEIIFKDAYPQPEAGELWIKSKRIWRQL